MKQWAVLIGLDAYQSLQPLNCAQQDVQALHRFLVSEAGFSLNQCLLFTESSPFLAGRSTYPNRENLCNWIEFLAQNYFQPDDQVWIFLNGYGVCHRGQDYFMPINGNPAAIEATCIAIAPLLSRLKSALPNGQPLLLLDISRSQGMISNETVGIQTAQVAHQLGIPTILSCQPGQFSREISSLGHGLFTASLLEGLRYHQGATLATLSHYLSDRLPELSEHYWQPIQHPVTICPPHLVHQPLLSIPADSWQGATTNGHSPQSGTEIHPAVETLNPTAAFTLPASQAVQSYPAGESEFARNLSQSTHPIPPLSNGQSGSRYTAEIPSVSNHSTQVESLENSYRGNTTATANIVPPALGVVESEPVQEEVPLWRPFLLWGGLIFLGLLSAVLWRNWSVVLGAPHSQQAPTVVTAPSATSQTFSQTPASGATMPVAIQPPLSPLPPTETMQPTSVNAGIAGAVSMPPIPQVPGETILQSARLMVRSDQATPYRDAIQQARKIQVGDRVYQVAQQDIAGWSQTIYTIAQERASRQQFDIAVMAADLVPLEDKKLRPQATDAIAQWCQFLRQPNSKAPFQQQAKSICGS
ncbi:MAG: hypothetical protein DCF22_09045 [Leptolyngbya sp.]|nr:MAG: hypothetical protein DCF22_09045 [Leptolyngbya sp.]